MNQTDSEDENVNDLITLTNEWGITGNWYFPKKLKVCPIHNCSIKFDTRSQAISHYRKLHSNAILCPGCEKPISAKTPHNFRRHFKEQHPGEEIPAYIRGKMEVQKKVANSHANETYEVSPIYLISRDFRNVTWVMLNSKLWLYFCAD